MRAAKRAHQICRFDRVGALSTDPIQFLASTCFRQLKTLLSTLLRPLRHLSSINPRTLARAMVEQSEPIALSEPTSRPTFSRNVTTSDLGRIHMQAVKNTVLKSHGRPPWYFFLSREGGTFLSKFYQVWRGRATDKRRVRGGHRWYVITRATVHTSPHVDTI